MSAFPWYKGSYLLVPPGKMLIFRRLPIIFLYWVSFSLSSLGMVRSKYYCRSWTLSRNEGFLLQKQRPYNSSSFFSGSFNPSPLLMILLNQSYRTELWEPAWAYSELYGTSLFCAASFSWESALRAVHLHHLARNRLQIQSQILIPAGSLVHSIVPYLLVISSPRF